MGKVGELVGQAALPDTPAQQVVLGVGLALAPDQLAIAGLLEAHGAAQAIAAVGVVDLLDVQVPAHVAIAVGDPVVAHLVPFRRTAQGIPLEGAPARDVPLQVVEQVQALFKTWRYLDRLHFRQGGGLPGHHRQTHGRGVDLVLLADALAVELVGHLHMVDVVRVQAEYRDAAIGPQRTVGHLVGNVHTALASPQHAHVRGTQAAPSIANDRGQRRQAIRVDHHVAEQRLVTFGNLGGQAGAFRQYRGFGLGIHGIAPCAQKS